MDTTFEKVRAVIQEIFECDESDIKAETRLIYDLDADSLDIIDLVFSLGKKLDIAMPTKPSIAYAMEVMGDEGVFIENECLTEVGVDYLIRCPNHYRRGQVSEGMTLSDVFENTEVQNWVTLCDAILQSESRDGDTLLQRYAEHFLKSLAKEAA